MDGELDSWQARIATHFVELYRKRSVEAPGRPIFALEHGLDLSDIQALARAVRGNVTTGAPSREHALPWIVYAAELGYLYSGDEYWQTFESETPGWTIHGDRYWIRDCFRSFHTKFGGAKPSGAWAEHFSIICWPITHAILPLDLQRQLARILYELRDSFSADMFESPCKLGEFIAARSWNATSRFQNLAQETTLVGQIAAALLLRGEFGTGSLIHPATLRRIGEDLERDRRAREWMRGARRFAHEGARIRGLSLGRGAWSSIMGGSSEETRSQVTELGIEPRLVLRPTDTLGASWMALLEIPDLSQLLLRFPRTREILLGARCRVAGAESRPIARGRFLHGPQRVALARWPRPDEVLLEFERTDPQLEFLLSTECLLRPGPTWLFRIASDGLAYESRSLRVRPGEKYIVLSTARVFSSSDHTRPVDLSCEGVHGVLLDIPHALTAAWEEALQNLGLRQAKTIEVWPAGLAAAVWDGEGHGEWLASERPCLAIRTDHPTEALIVAMSASPDLSIELGSIVPGEPIFVELPQLPVGLHTIRISSRGSPGADAELLGELNVVMRIRDARPWSPGVSPHGPLTVQIDPVVPSLEQVWEGRVEVTLRGPVGRHVKCSASLYEKDQDRPTVAIELPPVALPVSSDQWRGHFDKHFRETRKAEAAYDTARICVMEFKAEELGEFTLRCEREFTPLRWAVRRRGQDRLLHLIDDSGDSISPEIASMSFESPSVAEVVESASEYQVPSFGGLYVARLREFVTAVIVAPILRDFTDLRCVPRIDREDRSAESVLRTLALVRLWGSARLPGDPISRNRQYVVLQALTRHLFRILGGENWALAESAVRPEESGFADITILQRAISRGRDGAIMGANLAHDVSSLAKASCQERVNRFASFATRFCLLPSAAQSKSNGEGLIQNKQEQVHGDNVKWLAEFALRLASDPAGVEAWAALSLLAGLKGLFELPTLARAARFLVIATDRHVHSQLMAYELYAGWRWT
jgi:hypothetical protein